MNVELAPPSNLQQLEPGDFVEASLELVIIPMSAEDYYGPNENLRGNLKQHANSWQPVHRLATHNHLQVTMLQGELLQPYPLVVRVDDTQEAAFRIEGGAGYVPCTITGIKTPHMANLKKEQDNCTQENQYKQVNWNDKISCYEVTYNLPLDSPNDMIQTTKYTFTAHRE